jgi:hypothetical protein
VSAVADPLWSHPRRPHGQPPIQRTSVGREFPGGNFILLLQLGPVSGFLVLLSASSEGFRFHLLCSWNSSLDGGSVMVVLALSPATVLALRTSDKP